MIPAGQELLNVVGYLVLQHELQIDMRVMNRDLEGSPLNMVTNEQKLSFLRWNHTALVLELSEAMEETGWKPWASSRHLNYTAFIKEMVDAWHFWLNMMLVAAAVEGKSLAEVGMDFDTEYRTKNMRNRQRQQEGYDGITGKCPYCKRELRDADPIQRYVSGGLEFCNQDHAIFYQTERTNMSMHDEERVQEMRKDIEQRSGEGASASAEETTQAAQERHRAAQQAQGFDVVGPQGATSPAAFKDPAELFQDTINGLRDLAMNTSKNPHALKMVTDAEKTGEPLFCFRARDFFSIQVIAFYARIVEEYGPDDADFHNNIVDALGEFKEWQKDHITEVRYPD